MKKTAKTWGFNRFFVKSRKRDSNTRLTDYESTIHPEDKKNNLYILYTIQNLSIYRFHDLILLLYVI